MSTPAHREPRDLWRRLISMGSTGRWSLTVLLALVAASCSVAATVPPDEVTMPNSVTAAPIPVSHDCDRETVEDCLVAAIIFSEPVDLATAMTEVETIGGVALAVWRTDAVCVPSESSMPDAGLVASRFAYVDAGGIRARRLAAVNEGLSPPITGYLIAEAYWNHWEAQWDAATRPGVEIAAIAGYISFAAEMDIIDRPGVSWVVPVPSRRTDSLDPSYPGELLLVSEDLTDPHLPDVTLPEC